MKKYYYLSIVSFISLLLVFTQCTTEKEFDESLLIGTWKNNKKNTEKWKYDGNHRGLTWDTDEDIAENEGHTFSWSLDKSTLTLRIDYEIAEGKLPQIYTVVVLTSTVLEYKDGNRVITLSKN